MQLLKRNLLTVSLFASLSFCQGQNLQFNSIGLVVFEMAQHNIYESKTIGFTGLQSKQYQRFQQLLSIATTDQLIDLATNHHNAVVRLYSFQALHQKKITIPEKLSAQFENDKTMIDVYRGCVRETKSISNIAFTVSGSMNFFRMPYIKTDSVKIQSNHLNTSL